jgi:hypothetical protein
MPPQLQDRQYLATLQLNLLDRPMHHLTDHKVRYFKHFSGCHYTNLKFKQVLRHFQITWGVAV